MLSRHLISAASIALLAGCAAKPESHSSSQAAEVVPSETQQHRSSDDGLSAYALEPGYQFGPDPTQVSILEIPYFDATDRVKAWYAAQWLMQAIRDSDNKCTRLIQDRAPKDAIGQPTKDSDSLIADIRELGKDLIRSLLSKETGAPISSGGSAKPTSDTKDKSAPENGSPGVNRYRDRLDIMAKDYADHPELSRSLQMEWQRISFIHRDCLDAYRRK